MKRKMAVIVCAALALAGCSVLAPDYTKPTLAVPARWPSGIAGGAETQELHDWWRTYRDPELVRIIDEALANSGDLALTGARLKQVEAQYNYAFGNRFPLVMAGGGASRQQMVDNVAGFSVQPTEWRFGGALLTYEVDLWGKLANTSRAAQAQFMASSYNLEAARLSVAAMAARLYFTRLALDAKIRVMQDTIAAREGSLQLIRKQYEREAVNALALRQAESELEMEGARLPALLEQRDKTDSALNVLLGRTPAAFFSDSPTYSQRLDALPVPPVAPGFMPSSLLTRRADIAAAEQAMQAASLNIGVARAAYFPTISLSGLLGVTHADIQNLYSDSSRSWAIGGNLVGPLLDFGRTHSGVQLAEAQYREQVEQYKGTVRSAFRDVKDALSEQNAAHATEEQQKKAEQSVQEALRLARLRFESGYSSYLDVLDAERSLYAVQLARVDARLASLIGSLDLYKALGGGWKPENTEQKM